MSGTKMIMVTTLEPSKSAFRFVKKNKMSIIFVALNFFQIIYFDLSFSPEDTYSLKIWCAPVYYSRN